MPDEPVQSPSIKTSDFVEDNTRVYADVTTTLNVRTGPGTSYETLTSVDRKGTRYCLPAEKKSGLFQCHEMKVTVQKIKEFPEGCRIYKSGVCCNVMRFLA